eukprot:GHUV01015875.1.p1 GENE.GHUV01015875.1~~GHUV01015875.1.p1  ORF type:complete len:188 (+),score=31.76 GHUV01015875.1:474-1037(+)
MQSIRVVIVPGNGSGSVHNSNFYGWLHQKLNQPPAVVSVLRNMPDPVRASESVWIPFMRNELRAAEDSIIVGHSSGAAAAMRFCEQYKVAGIVLVSAYTTDQGDELEASSGYFNRPWQWNRIKDNAGFIVQFASTDDPFLPWSEQQAVADKLQAELHKFDDRGHFMNSAQPEMLQVLEQKIKTLLAR